MVNGKKLLAMFLVFTLLFSHSALLTESIATTGFVSLFGGSSDRENKNVEFEAYLANSNETSHALVSDVNNEELAILLQLDVKESGYLKNGKVEIKPEEEQELNFAVKENNNIAELADVQSLQDNILELNKIDHASGQLEIAIPIEYKMEEYINEDKFQNTAKIIFSGIYVDDKGDENEILKEVELTLAWEDNRTAQIENEISKYIQFGNDGVILQTIVKVDSSNENKNSLPTKATELNIQTPKINGEAPTEVTVLANSTVGTNGRGVGEVEFTDKNWEYNQEDATVHIEVENTKKLVDVNDFDEYLKVEGEEQKQEERYYSKAGVDEYVLTYTFQNATIADEIQTSSNIEAKIATFSGVDANCGETITTAQRNDNIALTGETGNIISYQIENETPEISKVYAYLNKEVEYNSKTIINVSYTYIVEEMIVEDIENYYIDESGKQNQTNDMYYKQISVSQENFNEILGEDGSIQILDASGNVLATINKEVNVDENGNYVVNFQSKISKITVKTSAPISTGNLIIANKKATAKTSISKANYANMEYIATATVQKAKFTYVSDLVELGNYVTKTKLNNTKTNFNLILDRDSLSTVTTNSNVEMRLELNNDEETSDIFGNSIFEVEMPEYITSLNVTNAKMLYGEGLDISNLETYVREGKIIIKITVTGKQTDLNSGVLTNGTNIVLNADITIDHYAPSKEETIKAYAYNSEATNYQNAVQYKIGDATMVAYQEKKVQYSAPNGVTAINTISNYKGKGTSVTSIKQGKQVDYIDIYADAKVATMEMVLMNNNENTISDLKVLGRIPFENAKDFSTNEKLGTTINTKMVKGISSAQSNGTEFTVYYSENETATDDLNRTENGWVTNPEKLENIKSYLIIPTDRNYQLEAKQLLRFSYEFEIPENLSHNEDIYGTFVASYTNNTETAKIEETAKPDLVGLTTGAGPELELNLAADVKTVKQNDEIKMTATIKNVGEDVARDVIVNLPIPANTNFVSAKADRDTVIVEHTEQGIVAKMDNLSKGTVVKITAIVKVGKVYSEDTITMVATTTAKDLDTQLSSNKVQIVFETAELSMYQFIDTEATESYYYRKGDKLNVTIRVENLTDKEQKNITVVTTLPEELEFVKAYMVGNESNIENATYDANTNKVTWNIDKISYNDGQTLKLVARIDDLKEGTTANTVQIATQVSGAETETYQAQDITVNIGKSSISITQTSDTPTYVMEGDRIQYTFAVRNEGMKLADNVVLTDIIPEGIVVRKLSYEIDGVESTRSISETEKTELTISVPAGGETIVNVTALASSLEGVKEKTVTNVGTIASDETEEIKSNTVTHIIQSTDKASNTENNTDEDENNETITNDFYHSQDITKSYKIAGIAWLDANKNGMRDDGEQRMSGVTAMLVDSTSGIIKSTTITNANGEYTFTGIQNGNYLVLFKYDTILYTTTTYRKEGIETNINSDAVTTKIEQNGKKENGAVTDVISINGASVTNMDIGLVETAQFSLGIDKAITKVTVQNAQGTVTEEFDKTKLSQYGIAAKYLAGTTVYVEYTMTVTNNGDLAGFASEIVDYIPQGMTFNSNLNPDWYTGTDGNLYTKALADSELVTGESKEVKLVLTKQMTTENTGIVSNTAEIADDFNIYGVSDRNSTPSNKAQGEDDISTADIILTVKTGESLIYISAIIVSILIGGAVAFVVYKRVLENKRKGGV